MTPSSTGSASPSAEAAPLLRRAIAAGMSPLTGASRVVGTHERAAPSVAALINGTAAHALELDDIYAPGLFHPGAPTVAAALAVADQQGSSMPDFRTAVMVGYEVGCRVARDLGPAHYAHWHTTGTAGSIGAAAAAATLLDLAAEPFRTHCRWRRPCPPGCNKPSAAMPWASRCTAATPHKPGSSRRWPRPAVSPVRPTCSRATPAWPPPPVPRHPGHTAPRRSMRRWRSST